MAATNAVRELGLIVSDVVIDGEIHRARVDGKRNGKPGWYVFTEISGRVYGTVGRWDTGQRIKISPKGNSNGFAAQDAEMLRLISIKVAEEKKRRQKEAAEAARRIVENAEPANPEHPYLLSKRILPHNALQAGETLIIPICDQSGKIINVQRIAPDGTKRFLYGGEIKGCFTKILGDGDLCLCEGFATAATIHEVTGNPVVIAFSAGNLVSVAKHLGRELDIICADNDASGTGIKYAKLAAEASGGMASVVMPEAVGDYNDHPGEALSIKSQSLIMSTEEACRSDDSLALVIPQHLIDSSGAIKTGMLAAVEAGAPDIAQYSFPVVTAMIARAISGKITIDGQWPSLYQIKVGPTSSGKTDTDRVFKIEMLRCGLSGFFGPTDFASGPGLLRHMADGNSSCLVTLDEVTELFRRYSDNTLAAAKIGTLLELYTASGTEFSKPYGDSKNNVVITNPCLILVGNATPLIFDEITIDDLLSGLIQRFDFFCYDGRVPYRSRSCGQLRLMDTFIRFVADLWMSQPVPSQPAGCGCNVAACIGAAVEADIEDNARAEVDRFSREIVDKVNDLGEDEQDRRGLVSRQFNLALKYALIVYAARGGVFKRKVSLEDIRWGIEVAGVLCHWKLEVLSKRVMAGVFHRDCETFKEAIRLALRKGDRPTGGVLAGRKRRLKELRPKQWDEIITALRARGEIIVDDTRSRTAYFIAKKSNSLQKKSNGVG